MDDPTFIYKILHERDKLAAMLWATVRAHRENGYVSEELVKDAENLLNTKRLGLGLQMLPATAGQSQPTQQSSEGLRLDHSGLHLQK